MKKANVNIVPRSKTFDFAKIKPKLSQVEILRRGQKIKFTLVTMGADEGLTIYEAAKLYNTTTGAIYKHLIRSKLTHRQIVRESLQELKIANVIPLNAPRAIWIPRRTLRDLARLIKTDSAIAAFHLLFDDSEILVKEKLEHDGTKTLLAASLSKVSALNIEYDRMLLENKDLRLQIELAECDKNQILAQIKSKTRTSRNLKLISEVVHRTTMFGETDVVIIEKALPLEKMTPKERKAWNGQHAAKIFKGLGRSIDDHFSERKHCDPRILNAASNARTSADFLLETIIPSNGVISQGDDE